MTTLAKSLSRVKAIALPMPKIDWNRFCIVAITCLICMSVFLLVSYVFGINQLTKGSYLIGNYEKKINGLTLESRELQMNFAESSFLGDIQDRVRQLSFEKTTEVKYIQVLDSALALKTK